MNTHSHHETRTDLNLKVIAKTCAEGLCSEFHIPREGLEMAWYLGQLGASNNIEGIQRWAYDTMTELVMGEKNEVKSLLRELFLDKIKHHPQFQIYGSN